VIIAMVKMCPVSVPVVRNSGGYTWLKAKKIWYARDGSLTKTDIEEL
jgi:hypothetical protein